MEDCLNCGFNSTGWEDITKKCKVEIAFTTTQPPMAYILLKHVDNVIGSFDNRKNFTYYSTSIRFNGEYKVSIIIKDGFHPYFRVFMKLK